MYVFLSACVSACRGLCAFVCISVHVRTCVCVTRVCPVRVHDRAHVNEQRPCLLELASRYERIRGMRARSPDDVHVSREHPKTACLRCKYIKLRSKWSARLTDNIGSGDEVLIVEEPTGRLPWGLGCLACHRYAEFLSTSSSSSSSAAPGHPTSIGDDQRWVQFQVGAGERKTLNIEDLLRHIGRSNNTDRRVITRGGFHVRAMEHFKKACIDDDDKPLAETEHGTSARDDVPSLAQFRICYDIVKRMTPSLGRTYESECTRAREGGDEAVTKRRSEATIAGKIAQSVSAALYEDDRQLLLQGKISVAGIAQDARKGLELTKVRFVTNDFDVYTRAVALTPTPDKKAIDKVKDLKQAITVFCNGSEPLKKAFMEKVIVSTADGELAEQLGLRLAKEGLFINQKAVLRCGLHMTQKTLENAVLQDPKSKAILDEFVLKASGSSRDDPGAFTRALRNSPRLKSGFRQANLQAVQELVNTVDSLSEIPRVVQRGASVMQGSAPQRFDSILVCLQRFCWNVTGIIQFLASEAISTSKTAAWAKDLLTFLLVRNGVPGPHNLLLLALLAEFCEAVHVFIRDQEAGKDSRRHHISRTAAQIDDLERKLSDLFDIEQADGKPRMPLALAKRYTAGYVNVIRKTLALDDASILVAAGKVAWFNEGGESTLQSWALTELGSILNIKKVFLAVLHSEFDQSLALAFRPFDISTWRSLFDKPEHSKKLRNTLKPIAVVLGLDYKKLAEEFQSAFPAALRLFDSGTQDLSQIWANVMKEAISQTRRKNFVLLGKAVGLMLASFASTGEIERNFSSMQAMSTHRRAGMGIDLLQSCLKIVLDGPSTNSFVPHERAGNGHKMKCIPTTLSGRAQNWYAFLFGGKHFKNDRSEISFAKKGKQIPGSMAHALTERTRELKHLRKNHNEPLDPSDATAVKTAMAERLTSEQLKTIAGRSKHAAKKRQQMLEDAAPRSAKRTKRLEEEENKQAAAEKLRSEVVRKTLAGTSRLGRELDTANILVISVGDKMEAARKRLRKLLGNDAVTKQHQDKLETIAASEKTLVWLVPHAMIGPMVTGTLQHLPDELKSAMLMSRLVGGFVTDDGEWLTACEQMHDISGTIPEPIVRFRPGLDHSLELFIHDSVTSAASWAIGALSVADGIKNARSKWVIRPDRQSIKCDAKGIALFGDASGVMKDSAKAKKCKNKAATKKMRLKMLPAGTTSKTLAKAKKKSVDAAAKVRLYRGTATTVEELARMITVCV